MPEVAVFLSITAEEEAATAVFHALVRRRYQGAQSLSVRSHFDKTALHPFVRAIGRHVSNFPWKDPALVFNERLSPNGLELLRVRVTIVEPDGREKWMYPLPPLDWDIEVAGAPYDFQKELSEVSREKNATSMRDYVTKLANRRNQILYASHKGLPTMQNAEAFLQYRTEVVFQHLSLFLLIDPFAQRQRLVQQGLNSFLAMRNRAQKNFEGDE